MTRMTTRLVALMGCGLSAASACTERKAGEPSEHARETRPAEAAPAIGGAVRMDGAPAPGMMVTARRGAVETTVFTDAAGRFVFDGLEDGTYAVRAHRPGVVAAEASLEVAKGRAAPLELVVRPGPAAETEVPTSSWLALLPDGEMRRELIINCGTCHGFGRDRVCPRVRRARRRSGRRPSRRCGRWTPTMSSPPTSTTRSTRSGSPRT